ncbi:LOB domain-containing protein 22-like [Phaseolus vulgaris]|uniref:LOB domain-containing protein 22-like n=1 Tax=Phaseolus vulgaris TaxID=3885 RepID=UPI0035CA15B7
MIKPLDPGRRNIAMATIIYESDMRAKDPVGGCLRIIQNLQSQIAYSQTELQLMLQHLAFFRRSSPPPSFSSHPSPLPFQFQHQFKSRGPLQIQEEKDPYHLLQEDIKLETDNQDAWRRRRSEKVQFHLGVLDLDLAIRIEKPAAITDDSSNEEKAHYRA